MTKHARYKLCVVPEFRLEHMRQPADRFLIAVLVGILEVVACFPVFILDLYYLPLDNAFRNRIYLLIGKSGEDFIRSGVFQSYKCNPLLFIDVESYHITVKNLGSFWSFLACLRFSCYQYPVS